MRSTASPAALSEGDAPRGGLKILYLRDQYHFGPGRIAGYFKRFHQLAMAYSSVHRILMGYGVSRLPANQKHRPTGSPWKRYEKPQPGHRVQMDVKFLEADPRPKKRLYQFAAIDDCTRIRAFKVYDACNQPQPSVPLTKSFGGSTFDPGPPDGQRRRVPISLPLAPRSA